MCLAVPARVERVAGRTALADIGGFKEEISLEMVSGILPGDYVLVHAGYAVARLQENEANSLLAELQQLFGGDGGYNESPV